MLVKQMSEEKNKMARSVFARMDKDRSGSVNRAELEAALDRSDSNLEGNNK